MEKEQARRYNKGKIRYELIPPEALNLLAQVYTKGAHKYTKYSDQAGNVVEGKDIPFEELSKLDLSILDNGAHNWRKGQQWTESMGSIKRHIIAWEKGEDIDSDLGTYHLANAAWGLMSLLTYYKIFPQGDDRNHSYLKPPKIGLDIDDVICDFVPAFMKKFNIPQPLNWDFSYKKILNNWYQENPEEMKEFYLNLPVKTDPKDIPFEPHCYITSRSIPIEWTQEWIEKNHFPCKKVYSIAFEESKIKVAKESGITIFVDDKYSTFVELNNAGICCFLFDSAHNQKFDVGYKRIKSLKELI